MRVISSVLWSAWTGLILMCIHTESISLENELTLTLNQKQALDQFRDEVSSTLPHEYMKKDIYLIKWLRAKDFNIGAAKSLLLENLRWREENKMDEVATEEFSFYEKEYPFWLDGRDKQGRPVGSADISAWDPRPAIISGKGEQLLRFMLRVTERASNLIREDQEAGKNVTQLSLVANLDGFNLIQHGCLRCIPIYIRYLLSFQNYYPGLVHKLFLVNTPAAFDVLLNLVYPVLSDEIKDFLKIHGTNKAHWKKAVFELISADQIRPQFGGTRQIGSTFYNTDYNDNDNE